MRSFPDSISKIRKLWEMGKIKTRRLDARSVDEASGTRLRYFIRSTNVSHQRLEAFTVSDASKRDRADRSIETSIDGS